MSTQLSKSKKLRWIRNIQKIIKLNQLKIDYEQTSTDTHVKLIKKKNMRMKKKHVNIKIHISLA